MANSNEEYLKMRRADKLLRAYNFEDNKYNRGEGDLTVQWIIENIFTKPCAHCGKTGWDVIGCNRLDDSKPHTKDNVEPCCYHCNCLLNGEKISKQVYQYSLDGKLVKIWNMARDASKIGYSCGNISMCCNGKRKTHKGYRWSYTPL
jgi:hypothetical protein